LPPLRPYDHPDFVGGMVWTDMEIRAIQRYAQASLLAKEAECEALRKDAERYRWLRTLPVECPTDGLDVAMWNDCHGDGIRGDALDSAIDAALVAAKGETK